MKKHLEVGDKITMLGYGKPIRVITIERVTKTQAISGNKKFKRDSVDHIRVIGSSGFYGVGYALYDADRHYIPLLRNRLSGQLISLQNSISSLTDEQVKQLYKFLKELEN